MSDHSTPPIPVASTFSSWLIDPANANLDESIAATLAKVAAEVNLLDRDGSVTLTLKVAKNGRRVTVTPEVRAKIPTAPNETSTWFASQWGLSRDDPYFMTFDDLAAPTGFDPDTGELDD